MQFERGILVGFCVNLVEQFLELIFFIVCLIYNQVKKRTTQNRKLVNLFTDLKMMEKR